MLGQSQTDRQKDTNLWIVNEGENGIGKSNNNTHTHTHTHTLTHTHTHTHTRAFKLE